MRFIAPKLCITLFAACTLLSSTATQAQSTAQATAQATAPAAVIDELRSLYEAGKAQETLALANQHLFDLEGVALFDFYYGVASLDTGDFQRGIFALERVVTADPENARIRLELGRGYYLIKQYDRAKLEFQTVLASNPPEQVRSNVETYLEAIEQGESTYTPTLSGYVELLVGHDSNANTAPGSPEFSTPTLGTGVLDSSSTSQPTLFGESAVGLSYAYPLNRKFKLLFDGVVRGRINENAEDFDTSTVDYSTGLRMTDGDSTVTGTISGQEYMLDYAAYRRSLGVGLQWSYALTPTTLVSFFGQRTDLDYAQTPVLDSALSVGGISVVKAFDWPFTPVINASYYLMDEDSNLDSQTAQSSADRGATGASAGITLTLDDSTQTKLSGSASWQNSLYSAESALFLRAREDDLFSFNIGISRKVWNDLTLSLDFDYSVNDSNIPINDYDQDKLTLKARYDF